MVNIARGDENNTATIYVLCVFSVLAEGKTLSEDYHLVMALIYLDSGLAIQE